MDCLEFRRTLGSDPALRDAAARVHLESCPRCADAHARAQAFEARLAQAINVTAPEGLADRILLAQLTATRQRQRLNRHRLSWVALAAAACLAVAIGIVRQQPTLPATLGDLVVEHVTKGPEQDALNKRAALADTDIRKAFADRGVALVSVPKDIAYVHECDIADYKVVHMVMPENGRPVSVVYVPRHHVEKGADFSKDGLKGREVPIADGTLVMLAKNSDSFASLENNWRDAIEGPAQTAAGGL